MKILHVFKDYYPVEGGIENHIRILGEFQAQQGLDVTVLTTNACGMTSLMETINSVKVIRAARVATVSSTPISVSLVRWMTEIVPDITHLHIPYPVGEIAHLLWGRSRHTIVTYHSDIVKQRYLLKFYAPFLRKLLQRADCVIATSPQFAQSSPFLRQVNEKCRIVPYGVDIRRFSTPDEEISCELRRRYGGGRPIVLFVGRLRYFKGARFLIEAMTQVDATLFIIGAGSEEHDLKDRVSKEGLQHKVVFLGEIPNSSMPEHFEACDVFVLPSTHRSESFGIVLIEAMACGKPVISTELGTGTSFINVNGKTGFVVPPRNPEALARALNRILKDEALRRELGFHARRRAQEFSSKVMNERVLSIYHEFSMS